MIYYLKGEIVITEKDFVVVDVNGVGYKVFVASSAVLSKKVILYCYMQVTDKGFRLYGFENKENLDFFEKLMNISGIGPKTALRIASIAPMEEMKEAIKREDEEIMKEIFSIGEKKGQQIVFELSRKFIKEPEKDEVFETLQELGFSQARIKEVLKKVSCDNSKEERVKEALKILGNA